MHHEHCAGILQRKRNPSCRVAHRDCTPISSIAVIVTGELASRDDASTFGEKHFRDLLALQEFIQAQPSASFTARDDEGICLLARAEVESRVVDGAPERGPRRRVTEQTGCRLLWLADVENLDDRVHPRGHQVMIASGVPFH
eukprot:scaffold340_cov256-Pinguiococcus_pyrenoidosus.AAC.48